MRRKMFQIGAEFDAVFAEAAAILADDAELESARVRRASTVWALELTNVAAELISRKCALIIGRMGLARVIDSSEVSSFLFEAQARRQEEGGGGRPIGVRVACLLVDEARKRFRSPASLPEEYDAPARSVVPDVEAAELRQKLIDCLGKLPQQQRLAFVLRETFGLTFPEVGRQLHCSEGAARTHWRRARSALQLMLSALEDRPVPVRLMGD
jgi:RNA polymerase sigma factor (sigma-70 family)